MYTFTYVYIHILSAHVYGEMGIHKEKEKNRKKEKNTGMVIHSACNEGKGGGRNKLPGWVSTAWMVRGIGIQAEKRKKIEHQNDYQQRSWS